MRKFLFILFSLFVWVGRCGFAQQATAVSSELTPVPCILQNGSLFYTYVLSEIQQSCSGGEGCVNGVISFGYTTSSGVPASSCNGSSTSACLEVAKTTTAGCSANCVSNCSMICSGSNCHCETYTLGCPDPCQGSLDLQNADQYLMFNVAGSRIALVYDVYLSSSSAYVTTISVELIYSGDGSSIIASIPVSTGFTIGLEGGEASADSVTATASSSVAPRFVLKYTPPV